jgi:hypothetical protein
MISTAWLAGRQTNTGPLEWGALLVRIDRAAAILTLAIQGVRNPTTADPNSPLALWRMRFHHQPPAIDSMPCPLPSNRQWSGICLTQIQIVYRK